MRLITVLILLLYTVAVSAKMDTLVNKVLFQDIVIDSSDQAILQQMQILVNDGKISEALQGYQQLMIESLPDFNEEDIDVNPSESDLYYCSPVVVKALLEKSNLLELQANSANRPGEHLEKALSCRELAMDGLFHLRQNFYGVELSYNNGIPARQQEWEAINLAYDLYEKSNDPSYLLRCFRLVEKSKKASLSDALINPETSQLANVKPENLTGLAEQKKKVGQLYTDWANALFTSNNNTTEPTKRLESSYVSARKAFHRKLSEFSKRYPRVYSLRYNESIVTVGEIQNRLERPEQVLLSYHLTDRYLYGFVITLNGLKAKRLELPAGLNQQIIRFQEMLRAKEERKNCKEYEDLALSLFQILVKPFEPLESEVTIIPDGLIGYIPFNALLYQPSDNPCNFTTSPFLLNKYQIAFHYSAEAFAKDAYANNKNTGVDLATLSPGNIDYANRLNGQLKGELIQTDKEPIKSLLKAMAIKPLILFANELSSFSGSKRNQSSIKWLEAEKLGLDNPSSEAPLVMVSACDVYTTTESSGDHIPSLARGLLYHGSGSVLTTLWTLPDDANEQQLLSFFKQLKKGQSKSAALQKASSLFVKNQKDAIGASPSLWASYILIGNADPVTEKNWYWFLLLLLPIAWGAYYWRKRKRERIRKEREVNTTMEY